MTEFVAFNPRAFQFWSNNEARPKRVFEAILIFPDLIFGGDGLQNIEPYLVTAFSRPGYSSIETTTGEYQLNAGDFAKIEYPTQGFKTNPLKVTLLDVVNHDKGANTAAAVNTSLILQGKTSNFEEGTMLVREGELATEIQNAWRENPTRFNIIEFDHTGRTAGEWIVEKPVLTSVNFSPINYKGSGFGTIDLTFQYKNFEYMSAWGDRLLANREKAIASGKDRNLIANTLEDAGNWWADKMNWTD